MAHTLTDVRSNEANAQPLVRIREQTFLISIERQLERKFCFNELDVRSAKKLHNFIDETIGNGLSISAVDKSYLRTKGGRSEVRTINGVETEVFHYGKDRDSFRLFGYYNRNYFVLLRIDCKHATHRQK